MLQLLHCSAGDLNSVAHVPHAMSAGGSPSSSEAVPLQLLLFVFVMLLFIILYTILFDFLDNFILVFIVFLIFIQWYVQVFYYYFAFVHYFSGVHRNLILLYPLSAKPGCTIGP